MTYEFNLSEWAAKIVEEAEKNYQNGHKVTLIIDNQPVAADEPEFDRINHGPFEHPVE